MCPKIYLTAIHRQFAENVNNLKNKNVEEENRLSPSRQPLTTGSVLKIRF